MTKHDAWAALFAAVAIAGGVAAVAGDAPPSTATFFEAFEKGDAKAALAALPAEVRDASPYDAATEALAPEQRDAKLHAALAERMAKGEAVPEAARADAIVAFDLGVIARKDGDAPRAMRKFLLAVVRNPYDRMAHLALARLGRTTGYEFADEHLDLAKELVDGKFPKPCPVVRATFVFAAGAVKDLKLGTGQASANDLDQRNAVDAPSDRDLRVVLLADDHGLLDERWFAPVRTTLVDGVDEKGARRPDRVDQTTFDVTIDLLAPRAGARVAIYDAAGKRLLEQAVTAEKAK